MSYEPLVQYDTPCIEFCQSADCSTLTMNIGKIDYFMFGAITSVTLEVVCGAYTTGVLDITSDIITPLTGTISVVAMDHTITGTLTVFTTELTEGDWVIGNGSAIMNRVYSITDNTHFETVYQNYVTSGPLPFYKVSTSYTLTPTMVGMTAFEDGTYEATLTIGALIDGSPQVFTIEKEFAVVCNNFCCIYEKLAAFADSCDDCLTNERMKLILDALTAWGLMEAYLAAPYCGDTVSFATLNTKLTEICNSTPCQNC